MQVVETRQGGTLEPGILGCSSPLPPLPPFPPPALSEGGVSSGCSGATSSSRGRFLDCHRTDVSFTALRAGQAKACAGARKSSPPSSWSTFRKSVFCSLSNMSAALCIQKRGHGVRRQGQGTGRRLFVFGFAAGSSSAGAGGFFAAAACFSSSESDDESLPLPYAPKSPSISAGRRRVQKNGGERLRGAGPSAQRG